MTTPGPLRPGAGVVARLRERLIDAGYDVSGVQQLLGDRAHRALARDETSDALRRTRGGSHVETLTRLWLLQIPVPRPAVDAALGDVVEALIGAEILAPDGDLVRALVDVRPYADDAHASGWFLASDLTLGLDGGGRRIGRDAVVGASGASTSLAQLTVRRPVVRALDLGTGCGVQALHLTTHADTVVATDVNERALALAEFTAQLSGVDVGVREGSLFEPVAGEEFDLVVSNPPFVVSPGTRERLVYRDSGLPADEMVRRVVTGGAEVLAPGGLLQVLGNWVHVRGQSWQERVGGWIEDSGCDAWVVEREVLDPCEYVELWLKDAGVRGTAEYVERYDSWLAWFDDSGIDGVGMGWLTLRRTDRAESDVRLEEWPHAIEQPIGPAIAQWSDVVDRCVSMSDDTLAATRLVQAHDLVEERYGPPGAADPYQIVLRQQRGMRRARTVSTEVAAFVGACDGDLTVAQISDALAQILEVDASVLRRDLVAEARSLVHDSYLH